MGRSFLSVKLAAVFGLVVAAAVTAQERHTANELDALRRPAAAGVIVTVERVDSKCDAEAMARVHTVRARARVERAAAAVRS